MSVRTYVPAAVLVVLCKHEVSRTLLNFPLRWLNAELKHEVYRTLLIFLCVGPSVRVGSTLNSRAQSLIIFRCYNTCTYSYTRFSAAVARVTGASALHAARTLNAQPKANANASTLLTPAVSVPVGGHCKLRRLPSSSPPSASLNFDSVFEMASCYSDGSLR